MESMTEPTAAQEPTEHGDGEPPIPEDSLLGRLADIHQEIKTKEYFKDVAIPGYDSLLWIRCRPYDLGKRGGKRMSQMRRRVENNDPYVILDTACDTLIDACDQVMILDPKFNGDKGPEGENLKPLDDEIPVKFDSRLSTLLKLGDTKGARDVVKELFPTQQSIVTVSAEVDRWLRDVTKDADGDFLGE